jgi:hypothetical protein
MQNCKHEEVEAADEDDDGTETFAALLIPETVAPLLTVDSITSGWSSNSSAIAASTPPPLRNASTARL